MRCIQSVSDEISAKRQQAMESIVGAVHNEIERYSNPEASVCKFREPSCDAMVLGLLFRAFRKAQIYPEASIIIKKSVEKVKLILHAIEFPELIPTNKLTGCCATPMLSQATEAGFGGFGGASSSRGTGGLFGTAPSTTRTAESPAFGQFATPAVVNRNNCANCKQEYQALKDVHLNHAKHCVPIPRLRKNVDDIVARVTGVEYRHFVRKGSDEQQAEPVKQALTDLWSTVEYSLV